MVLRGSAIHPEGHLPEEAQAVIDSRKGLQNVTEELQHEREKALEALSRTTSNRANMQELKQVAEHVQELEEKKKTLYQEFLDRRAELERTARQLACGGAAGAIARSTVAPMDRIKILMQVAHVQKTTHLYGSMAQTFGQILKNEGPVGFWRGNFTNCVRVVPHTATQFVAYDKIKVAMCGSSDGKLSVPQRLLAGSLSGIAAASVTQPLDVVRIRLQTDPTVQGKVGIAVRSMWSEGGIKTFYKGYTPAMLSLAPFIAVNFATFDTLKTWWYGSKKCTKEELRDRNPMVTLSLGAAAGIIAQTVCYPLDTVRRRMQLKGMIYPNTVMAFITIAREEGYKGFYRGMGPNALKVMPNNAIRFATYEFLKAWFVEV